ILADPETWYNHGLVIELTHRLVAYLLGFLAIGLCAATLLVERGWRKLLGVAVLAAVVTQGLLGRYRVDLDALFGRNLAMIHGCFAPLVMALLVSVAVVTSRSWFLSPLSPRGRGVGVEGLFSSTPLTPDPSPPRGEGSWSALVQLRQWSLLT